MSSNRFTSIGAPIFDICKAPVIESNILDSGSLCIVGGGGSAKSGVKNSISILEFNKQTSNYQLKYQFLTGSVVLTTIDISACGKFLLCTEGASCILYKLTRMDDECEEILPDARGNQIYLSILNKFQTDALNDIEYGCQNVAKFLTVTASEIIILTAGEDKVIKVWSIETDSYSYRLDQRLTGHLKEIKDISIIDSHSFFSCSLDACCRLWTFDTKDKVFICKSILPANKQQNLNFRRINYMDEAFYTLKISNGGRGFSYLLRWRYDLSAEQYLPCDFLKVSKRLATCFDLSSKEKLAIIGTAEGDLVFVDLITFLVVKRRKKVHNLPITGICYISKTKLVASTSMDQTVHFTSAVGIKRSFAFCFKIFIRLLTFLAAFVLTKIFIISDYKNLTENTSGNLDLKIDSQAMKFGISDNNDVLQNSLIYFPNSVDYTIIDDSCSLTPPSLYDNTDPQTFSDNIAKDTREFFDKGEECLDFKEAGIQVDEENGLNFFDNKKLLSQDVFYELAKQPPELCLSESNNDNHFDLGNMIESFTHNAQIEVVHGDKEIRVYESPTKKIVELTPQTGQDSKLTDNKEKKIEEEVFTISKENVLGKKTDSSMNRTSETEQNITKTTKSVKQTQNQKLKHEISSRNNNQPIMNQQDISKPSSNPTLKQRMELERERFINRRKNTRKTKLEI